MSFGEKTKDKIYVMSMSSKVGLVILIKVVMGDDSRILTHDSVSGQSVGASHANISEKYFHEEGTASAKTLCLRV